MKAGDNSDEKNENNLTKREQYFKVNNVKIQPELVIL